MIDKVRGGPDCTSMKLGKAYAQLATTVVAGARQDGSDT